MEEDQGSGPRSANTRADTQGWGQTGEQTGQGMAGLTEYMGQTQQKTSGVEQLDSSTQDTCTTMVMQ